MVDPLLLDLLQPLLIALQRRLDRLEQLLELRFGLFIGLVEARIGAFEEILLRLAEQFAADLGELVRQRLARFAQLRQPRFERLFAFLGRRGKARAFLPRFGTVVAHRLQPGGELRHLPRPLLGGGELGAGGTQFLLRPVALRAQRRSRAPAQHPAEPDPAGGGQKDDDEDQRVHLSLPERRANLKQPRLAHKGRRKSVHRKAVPRFADAKRERAEHDVVPRPSSSSMRTIRS